MTVSKITQTGLYSGVSSVASQVGQSGQSEDFSQIFAAQSAGGETKTQVKTEQTENKVEETSKREDAVTEKATDEVDKNTEKTEEKTAVTETGKAEATEETEELDTEAVEKAINEIMAAIQQVLGVTNEELKSALQELGISTEELLNTDIIPKIVVALTEGADELSVMTNEELFANVQELTAKVEDVLKDLSNQFNLEPEEMKNVLQGMFEENVPEEELVKTSLGEDTANVPVMEEVRVQNVVTETENAAKSDDKEQNADSSAGQQMTFAQTVTERIEQAVAKMETTYSQATTESIMNQIEDVIKVIQKENLTEMELQLHPASLGTVKVALAAREGVITATFTAENEAVRAALETQMVTLKQSFEEQGIKVEAVEVTVASHAFERNLNGEGNKNTNDESAPDKKKGARRITLSDRMDEAVEEELNEEDRIVAEMMKQNGNTVDYTV